MDTGVVFGESRPVSLSRVLGHEGAPHKTDKDAKGNDVKPNEDRDAPKVQATAFTIDFGGGKSVDRQRIEDLMKKSQARHQRVQSLSRIDTTPQRAHSAQKPPMSAKLPRKSIGYNSEGYFSSDQEDSLLSIGGKSRIQSPSAHSYDRTKPYSLHNKSPIFADRMSESYHQGVTKPRVSKSPIVDSIMSRSDILPSRQTLNLPLKNSHASLFTRTTPLYDSMSQSYTDPSHDIISEIIDQSPDGLMLTDVSSPELDVLTPDNGISSTTMENSPMCSPFTARRSPASKYELSTTPPVRYDNNEKDDGHSSTVSEAGTYTIEVDNYTEEQKARMSIDKAFGVEHFEKPLREALESPESDPALVIDRPRISTDRNVLEISCCYESPTEAADPPHAIKNAKSTRNYLEKIKNRVRTISEKTFQKTTPTKPVLNLEDVGSFTSVTTSGVFNSKNTSKIPEKYHFKRRNSLTKSQIDASEYVHHLNKKPSPAEVKVNPVYNSTVLRNVVEKTSACSPVVKSPEHALVGKLSTMSLTRCHGDRSWIQDWAESAIKYKEDISAKTDHNPARDNISSSEGLPPSSPRNSILFKGHQSPLNSPTKIPSPIMAANSNTNHLQAGLTSGVQDTESFLLRTQDAISNLQARLSSGTNSAPPNTIDIRDRLSSSRLPVSQLTRSNSLSYRVRRGRESPLGSPLRSPQWGAPSATVPPLVPVSPAGSPTKILLHSRRASLESRDALPASPRRSAPPIATISPLHRSGSFGAGDTNSPPCTDDEDSACGFHSDFDRGNARKTIAGAGGTRYNRAFELRRARLESPDFRDRRPPANSPRCPNTPETRRKFPASAPLNAYENGPNLESRRVSSSAVKITPTVETVKQRLTSGLTKSHSSTRDFEPRAHERTKKSTVNIKDVEFTNWKKRSSYDPIKSATEAKKKTQGNKNQQWNIERYEDTNNTSPSHSSPVHRSQSFHAASALQDQQYTSDETEDEHLLVLVEPNGRSAMERAVHLRDKSDRGRCADVIISRDYLTDFHVNTKSTDRLGLRRDNYRELRQEVEPEDKRRTFVVDSDTNSTTNESSPRTSSIYSDTKMEDSSDFGISAPVNDSRTQHVTMRPKNTQRSTGNKLNRHSGDFSTISSSTTSTNRDHSAASRKGRPPDIQPRYLDISKYKNESSPKNFLRRDPSKTYVAVLPQTHHARDEMRKGSAMCIEQEMKSKELEKWKRRASYDPRKSAAQSRSKTVPASSTVLRSQSFHGPVVGGAMTSPSWRPDVNDCGSSDNDF